MSTAAKLTFISSCIFSVTIITWVHYRQSADLQEMKKNNLIKQQANWEELQRQQKLTEELVQKLNQIKN